MGLTHRSKAGPKSRNREAVRLIPPALATSKTPLLTIHPLLVPINTQLSASDPFNPSESVRPPQFLRSLLSLEVISRGSRRCGRERLPLTRCRGSFKVFPAVRVVAVLASPVLRELPRRPSHGGEEDDEKRRGETYAFHSIIFSANCISPSAMSTISSIKPIPIFSSTTSMSFSPPSPRNCSMRAILSLVMDSTDCL